MIDSTLPAPAATSLPPSRVMYRALTRRDPAYEGVFFAGVKTTGIFCRPTCRAKKPRAENVEFFASASAALHDGYRPCRLCRPLDRVQPPPPVVARLLRLVEADPTIRLTDKELIGLGIDPSTARRRFRSYYGLTFQAYQRARRLGLALHEVRAGRPVIDVQLDGGYESSSGFREAFQRVFGKPPRGARADDCLLARRIDTPLGRMLALADGQGLRLLEFVDRRGLENEILRLRRRLHCAVVPGTNATLVAAEEQLRLYFAGERLAFDLPLAPLGSAFQQQVWTALRRIRPGATRSYAQIAGELGRPGAQRAVGRANGSNALAIVIPCHRVVGADGSLSGYGGGIWRKQRLLEHERAHAGRATTDSH
ncbi:MAG TPA: methylated-DNA--[protein]-cysteine S-methyltransferase [Opitutaceae bacterium]|nr:methylated-DNA--[protein]-cysteine S-methyltransferase [Opitutaceae bacterium]